MATTLRRVSNRIDGALRCGALGALLAGTLAAPAAADAQAAPQLPDPIPVEGFEQLLPRGAIAALVDPTFVAASEAEIPGDAWVMGFAQGGEAFAYDLNLLNRHEVVNHGVEGAKFAAVW